MREQIRGLESAAEYFEMQIRSNPCTSMPDHHSQYCANTIRWAIKKLESLESKPTTYCLWMVSAEGLWHSKCGQYFEFNVGEPITNGFKFCPYCGKSVAQELRMNMEPLPSYLFWRDLRPYEFPSVGDEWAKIDSETWLPVKQSEFGRRFENHKYRRRLDVQEYRDERFEPIKIEV